MLSIGTRHLLEILNGASDITDLAIFKPFGTVWPFVRLFVFIEVVQDIRQYDGQVTRAIKIENKLLSDLACPRELIRFVHERKARNYLGSPLDELKATTRRTNFCLHCKEHKPFKRIK